MNRSSFAALLSSIAMVVAGDAGAQLILSPAAGPGGGPLPVATATFTYPAVPGSVVVIDMSGCTGMTPAPTPGVAVACGPVGPAGNTITAIAGPTGAVFSVLGHVVPGAVAPSGCAFVTVDGVFAGPLNIAAADLNGFAGCNAADGSIFIADLFSLAHPARSNFNGVGGTNIADGSIFLMFRDATSSDVTPPGGCP